LHSLAAFHCNQHPAPPGLDAVEDLFVLQVGNQAGGELEQIQFLLVQESVQTTERYLVCKQHLHNAGNDRIGLEPGGA
jgi:hypothetical protein